MDKPVDCFFVIAGSLVFLCRVTAKPVTLDRLSGPWIYATKPRRSFGLDGLAARQGEGLWVVSR